MSLEALRRLRTEVLAIASQHGARNVRVFGSVARGDSGADSDIDLLVDVESDRTLLDVIGLEQDLEQLLGAHVEVLTERGLSPYLQQQILSEAAAL